MIQTNTLVKAQKITSFKRSLAVVIGINEYQNKITKLQTARRDAEVLAQILAEEHQYDEVILITDETECKPTLKNLLTLLEEKLPKEIQPTKDDRLLFYFAGHGIARDSDKGPAGYLVPQDADLEKNENLLSMQKLYDCLSALWCRHLLVILDCCFAGTLRWSTARLATVIPTVIRKEHYDRFIKSSAWQAITSAAHNQEALDTIRLRDNRGGINHSPFALALFKALRGEGDVIPAAKNGKSAGDGVITATELYLYLRDHVETASNESQTPGIWTLSKHDRGEYIFLVPGAEPKLKPAPKLTERNNPYRGLQSFEEEHSQLFFGRKELIEELYEKVSHASSSLTVVSGVSGSGKSSLVKAGLIPYLRQNHSREWYILKPMRPSESPFTALARTLLLITNNNDIVVSKQLNDLHFIDENLQQKITDLNKENDNFDINSEEYEIIRLEQKLKELERIVDNWKRGTKEVKQRLIVDHFDELNNLCRVPNEQRLLKEAVLDCLNPLSQRLQDPNEFIKIIKTWSEQRPGFRLLLVIDQFEELITLSRSNQEDKQNKQPNLTESQQFLELLEATLAANLPQLSIVVTLRSDFEPRFLNSKALKSHWTHARFPVRAMRSDELRQAIERPAAEMALYFEQLPEQRNPVDRLVDEVGQMPGALPLLSFTLSELYIKLAKKWETGESSDRALTLDAEFDFEGGVAGSLTRRANQEYDSLPDDAHRDTMRRVMLRMVTVESGVSARRRVPSSELVYADKHDPSKRDDEENKRVDLVLERLNNARLIVSGQETGEPYVEPAHDFLVKSWDKLQKWQQKEQEDLLLQRRLTPNALEWKNKEQSASVLGKAEPILSWFDKKIDSAEDWFNKIKKNAQERQLEKKRQFLWNGNPYLDVLRKKLKSVDYWFNQVEAEFVQQSVWQRRRNVNLRWSIGISVVLLSSGLTFLSLIGQRNALMGQVRAIRQSAEANLPNQEFDALLDSLRAGKSLKDWPGYLSLFKPESKLPFLKPDTELQPQVLQTLRKIFYVAKEHNRIKVPQDFKKMFFAPDGTLLIATAGSDGIVYIQDLKGNKLPKVFSGDKANKDKVTLDVNRDGTLLATIDEQGTVRLWNLEGRQEEPPKLVVSIPQSTFSDVYDYGIKFSPDGKKLVASIAGQLKSNQGATTVYLWDLSGNEPKLLKQAQGNFMGINFNSSNQLIVATVRDSTLHLSDFMFSKPLAEFTDFEGSFFGSSLGSFIFSPDDEYLAAYYGADMSSAYVGGLNDKSWKDFTPLNRAASISFDASGKLIIGQEGDGTISIYEPYLVKNDFLKGLSLELKGHQGSIDEVISNSNGKRLASRGSDNTIRLWDLEDKPVTQLKRISNLISVSVSPDGKQLAVVESDGTVRLLDLNANELKRFVDIQGKISQIIFSPDGQQLAAIGKDSTIRLLNLNGKELYKSPNFEKTISQLIFRPDGQQLAIVENDGTIHLLNLNNTTWETLPDKVSPDHEYLGTRRITFSSDGRLLVAQAQSVEFYPQEQGNISLRELESNKELVKFQDAKDSFSSINLNTQGSLLASADSDIGDPIPNIYVWDMSGRLLTTFKDQQPGKVTSISLSADGSLLATLSEDGTAKLWQIGNFDKLLEQGCDRVRDYLATLDENNSDRHLCDDIIGNSRP
jgi:WD40 repeat protein